jgi:hypothetical protein
MLNCSGNGTYREMRVLYAFAIRSNTQSEQTFANSAQLRGYSAVTDMPQLASS